MHKRPRALERGQQGLHSPIILQPAFLRLWSRFFMDFFSCAVSFTVVAIFAWLSAQGNYPWISSLPPDEQSITIEFDKDKEEKEHTINAILPALGLSQPNFSLGSICYPLSTPWNRTTPPIRFVAILRDVVRTFAVDYGIADFDLGTSLRSELNQLFLHILVPKSSP